MKHARRLLFGLTVYAVIFGVIAGAVALGPWSAAILVAVVLLVCSYAMGAARDHYR